MIYFTIFYVSLYDMRVKKSYYDRNGAKNHHFADIIQHLIDSSLFHTEPVS